MVSPQELEARDPAVHSGHEAICLLGEWDGAARTFTRRAVLPVDQGLDFYAPRPCSLRTAVGS